MELHQLKAFLTVARTRNLTRAAELLAASQPAVSGHIKALEASLGVTLFSRTPRGMELTSAGERLLPRVEELEASVAGIQALAAELSGQVQGTCRIGLNTEAGGLRIPQLVDAVSAAAPSLRLELVQGVTRSILEDVAVGRLHAGFVFGPASRGLAVTPLARMELVVAAPAAWRARLEGAPLEELLREPWIWPPADCPFHEQAVALFREAGRTPPAGVTADQEATLLRLVGAGVGMTLLPAFLVREAEAKGDVWAVRAGRSEIELGIAWRAGEEGAPLLAPVLAALRQVWS